MPLTIRKYLVFIDYQIVYQGCVCVGKIYTFLVAHPIFNYIYFSTIKPKLSKRRIYDLVDTAIFDFLMQNGDRHHYETLDDAVVWIDNGKGLGNPYVHHIDILAPLFQCCM